MKRGRKICETLKSVRKSIADANNICYEPQECNHKGDCNGTCPACEAEVRYIESELSLRKQMGEAIRVAGVAAGIGALAISCTYNPPSQSSTDNHMNTVETCNTTKEFITIRGNITDESGKPVVSAFVGTMKSGETVKTDQRGNFCVLIPSDSLLRIKGRYHIEKSYNLSDLDINGFNQLYYTDDDRIVVSCGVIDLVEEMDKMLANSKESATVNDPIRQNILNETADFSTDSLKNRLVTINGCIKDESGKPVVSAFVGTMKKGETVTTDLKGNFCVKIPRDSLLRVRYIGYKDKEYKLSDLKINGFDTLYYTEADLEEIAIGEIAVEEVEEEYIEGNMPNYIIIKDSKSVVKDSTKLKSPNREN